uniref:Uncharacterized protein n=1 Tax=Kalanchoe fedtschenkoi TaxID=63787 RepID=A0A7N1A956_KALFE
MSHNEDDDVTTHLKCCKRYEVWLDFKTFTRNSLEFTSASHVSGTSHLKKHLAKCMEKYGIIMNVIDEQPFVFDQEKSINDFATTVIKHSYCFNMIERNSFEIFYNGLKPNFKLISRNTLRSDTQLIHQKKKERMHDYLDSISSRVQLTTDIWTTRHQCIGCNCITAHFVDDDWILKKKIISFQHIEYSHDDLALNKALRDSFLDWTIDRKLFF